MIEYEFAEKYPVELEDINLPGTHDKSTKFRENI